MCGMVWVALFLKCLSLLHRSHKLTPFCHRCWDPAFDATVVDVGWLTGRLEVWGEADPAPPLPLAAVTAVTAAPPSTARVRGADPKMLLPSRCTYGDVGGGVCGGRRMEEEAAATAGCGGRVPAITG